MPYQSEEKCDSIFEVIEMHKEKMKRNLNLSGQEFLSLHTGCPSRSGTHVLANNYSTVNIRELRI